jgi:hypothetical protein
MIRLILGLMVVMAAAAPSAFAQETCFAQCTMKKQTSSLGCRVKSSTEIGPCMEAANKADQDCRAQCAKQYKLNESTGAAHEGTHGSTEPEHGPSTGPVEGQPTEPRR